MLYDSGAAASHTADYEAQLQDAYSSAVIGGSFGGLTSVMRGGSGYLLQPKLAGSAPPPLLPRRAN